MITNINVNSFSKFKKELSEFIETKYGEILKENSNKVEPVIFKDGVCYISEASIKDAGFDVTYEGGTSIEHKVHISPSTLKSDDYIEGVRGWCLNKDGSTVIHHKHGTIKFSKDL